jgi:hypothetical protein
MQWTSANGSQPEVQKAAKLALHLVKLPRVRIALLQQPSHFFTRVARAGREMYGFRFVRDDGDDSVKF